MVKEKSNPEIYIFVVYLPELSTRGSQRPCYVLVNNKNTQNGLSLPLAASSGKYITKTYISLLMFLIFFQPMGK